MSHEDVPTGGTSSPEDLQPGGASHDNLQAVYEQYWRHARHNENEMWSFTRVWAVILAAVFASLGAEIDTGAKIGAAVFGIILSILGFSLVYTVRKPFLIYFWTVDLIASEEFEVPSKYRRLDDDMDHRLDKTITVSSILFVAYSIVAAILTVISFALVGFAWFGVQTAALVLLVCLFAHNRIRKECLEECNEIREEYSDSPGVPD